MDECADPLQLSSAFRPVLIPGETILLQQKDIGLCEGNKRLLSHDKGVAYLSTHRILWVPEDATQQLKSTGSSNAITIQLANITKMELMPAFVTQSPKIALHLTRSSSKRSNTSTTTTTTTTATILSSTSSLIHSQSTDSVIDTWICPICSTRNVSLSSKCSECGVKKSITSTEPFITISSSTAVTTTTQSPSLYEYPRTYSPYLDTPPPPSKDGKPCKACTFNNHPDMIECEVCGTPLDSFPSQSPIPSPTPVMNTGPISNNVAAPFQASPVLSSPIVQVHTHILKLSFRSHGMPDFAKVLRAAIQKREWENASSNSVDNSMQRTASPTTQQKIEMMSGIGSIMRNVDQNRAVMNETLSEAFRDLDALMQKASGMVKLAESISAKLSAASATGSTSEDSSEMATFREYLVDLGISSPVTKKTAGDMYDQELSRQLAEFLELVLLRSGGMMTLVDVYCIFNRARGVALISPDDLIRACQLFEKLSLPHRLRRFDSGLLVVQSQTHHDEDTVKRVRDRVQQATVNNGGGLTAIQLATTEKISVMLAKEQLMMTEARAWICRDDTVEGLRFYDNLILYG